MYIQATAAMSPQKTFGQVPFLIDQVIYPGNRLQVIEPAYNDWIEPKLLRRMSRIIRMGVSTAKACLQEGRETNPGAIITATAYGCLEDTGIFLTETIERKEEMPPPTAFIQSTHNTVGSQIALMLKCHNYNNTFVHNGFSFESALLDAMLLLKEKEAHNVLIGSIDELTDNSFAILNRLGLYKRSQDAHKKLFSSNSKGTVGGEGSAFFLLTDQQLANSYARIDGMTTLYQPKDAMIVEDWILSFLNTQAVTLSDIDLVIIGENGDTKDADIYQRLKGSLFSSMPVIPYKHLCGEYPTSISFALWLAANILKTGEVPLAEGYRDLLQRETKKILIYNHYQRRYHSLLLLSQCK